MNTSFNRWERSLRPRRSNQGCLIVLAALTILFGLACLNGWLFMLAIGILSAHGVVGGTLPFWDSVCAAALLISVFATSANVKASKS